MLVLILYSILLISIILLFIFMLIAMISGAPFVPSRNTTGKKMVELLKLKKSDKFFDLGSGDGRLLVLAAKAGAEAYGVEINPFAVLISYIRSLASENVKNIHPNWGNLWNKDISQANKVAVYGIPYMMKRLSKKIKSEVKPGALVISNSFQIPGLKLIKEEKIGKDRLFLYKI